VGQLPPALGFAAYWFHTVTALNMSLSLSVVSPSEEEMIYSKVPLTLQCCAGDSECATCQSNVCVLGQAFWLKVPFGNLTSRRDKVIGTHVYLTRVLSKFPHIQIRKWVVLAGMVSVAA
jgi:hypothetical protein